MENEENKVAEATTTDESLELDLNLDGTGEADAQTVDVRHSPEFRQVLARAKKAEAEAKALREASSSNIKEDKPKSRADIEDEVWGIAEMIREGYTRQDVDFIKKNGGREALNDENSYVSIALRQKMEQRRAEEAASQTANSSGASEVERKYTPEQLKNMSVADLEKILPKA